MKALLLILRRLASEQKAATAVEYGLMIAFIVLAMLIGLQAVGSVTGSMWNNVSDKVLTAS